MSGIQPKIASHAKMDNMTHNEKEKKQQNETDPEWTQMLELADKDMQIVAMTLFHMPKKL